MATYFSRFSKYVTGTYWKNSDLISLMDTSHEWIVQRTGIEGRYWVDAPTTTSDLGAEAAKITVAGTTPPVDCIIAATLSPDFSFPGIGVLVQNKLGLPQVPAYDIRNQCSGFLYAAQMAHALVSSGEYACILLVCAEVHSTGIDKSTRGRDIAVLFGDGAGACLVTREPVPGCMNFRYLGSELHSDGAYVAELWCEHPGSAHFPTRLTEELIRDAKCFPAMNGKVVFQHAVKQMVAVSQSLLEKAGRKISEVGLFLPHQANLRINSTVAEYLHLKPEQVFNTIQKYGNTTAATIPIGFTEALEHGKISSGDIVLSAAFGAGFTWGAALFEAFVE